MLRYLIAIFILSILVVVGSDFLQIAFNWLYGLYRSFDDLLKLVIAGGHIAALIRQVIALMVIPLVFAAIPAIVYGLLKRRAFPFWIELAWAFWVILAVLVVAA